MRFSLRLSDMLCHPHQGNPAHTHTQTRQRQRKAIGADADLRASSDPYSKKPWGDMVHQVSGTRYQILASLPLPTFGRAADKKKKKECA